jgi:hypothetical protein
MKAFVKMEGEYGAECPTRGDLETVHDRLELEATEFGCDLYAPLVGPASIVVVPIQVTASSDPTLTLRNISSSATRAYCFYAWPCLTVDFEVPLPPQGSTSWQAGVGVPAQGIVPVPYLPFSGELVCVQVVSGLGSPFPGDDLIAFATTPGSCRTPGIRILSGADNNDDTVLMLGTSGEYGPCPPSIAVSHIETCWTNNFSFDCQ